jgi:DNA-binding IscR family transcriptional regulator
MLRLSKKADYALIAMAHLAMKAGSVSAREIAENYDIPTELMAKVLQRLARRNLLTSQQAIRWRGRPRASPSRT